ncbi:zinc finger CCCH domain-containing protein 3 isoform X2 [Strix aluco]|uniref:zinc finger CCCH domain-containing protein 3 isoform X2 n=1 Tax=Strix aluco TaxID=111821 RepID=UPI003DA5F335
MSNTPQNMEQMHKCTWGANLHFIRSPPANKVIKTRYRIVKKNVVSPALSSFSSPIPNWKTRRPITSRSPLLNQTRPSPQGVKSQHVQQRWRSKGYRCIGGVMYRVSANKLSKTSSTPGRGRDLSTKSPGRTARLHCVPSPGFSPSGCLNRSATSRYIASRAVQRSLAIIRQAKQKKKKKEYCMYYNRFGKCNRGESCPYIHDPEKVAVCTRFLRGTCKKTDGTCSFSHKVSKDKMPVCSYFLKGICSNSNCPYSHVYVSRKAEVCQDFLKGYCPMGEKSAGTWGRGARRGRKQLPNKKIHLKEKKIIGNTQLRRSAWCFYHCSALGFQAGAGLVSVTVDTEMDTGPRRWENPPALYISCLSGGPLSPAVPRERSNRAGSEMSLEILEKFNLDKLLVEQSREFGAGWDLSYPPCKCKKKHTLVCPDFAKKGVCPRGARCKLLHPQKKRHPRETEDGDRSDHPSKWRRVWEEKGRNAPSQLHDDGEMPGPSGGEQEVKFWKEAGTSPTSRLQKLPSFISLQSSSSPSDQGCKVETDEDETEDEPGSIKWKRTLPLASSRDSENTRLEEGGRGKQLQIKPRL